YCLRFFLSVFPFTIYLGIIGLKNLTPIHVLTSLILNIILNSILIPKFGGIGAIISTIISTYLSIIIPIFLIKSKLKCKFVDFFPVNFYFKVIIVSVILILPFLFLFKIYLTNYNFVILLFSIFYYLITLLLVNKF